MSVSAAEASGQPRPARTRSRSRVEVADIAVRLFRTDGYEATTATDIARAAGVSRSTFFRQFRSKEDVIFADHDELAVQIAAYFAVQHDDPWRAIRDAATMVFERFRERLDSVRVRDLIVRDTPTLRDRETIMAIRYEQMFAAYLRSVRPDVPPLTAIRYAAAITATHNYELRRLIRGPVPSPSETDAASNAEPVSATGADLDAARDAEHAAQLSEELAAELRKVGRLFHPDAAPDHAGQPADGHQPAGEASAELVVAVFPGTISPDELSREVARALGGRRAASTSGPAT
ncbi:MULTISPECIES: TetR/AcrR family transcriptional regulator [unclassified Cryobacterium]|uniref:TetR/AcrR family transcriptional regulator n=1 Tax=unclassified Cryobacterium TaxID=2649013 RepID=UPI00106C04A6|nr:MULTISPECIES: TetR/AcrR family transcriptional regulator [unclassified Cryobacterium]TFB98813.1 TetR family transcriptional regulator [Cryobacterium sp. MDB2-A-1]TFC04271.1 TetR family transcriptional regulator [Cryobacterium sp. MDB2-33-2]TFC14937.1 TetR family transcriptional regulator [Cryobacterium sp. MDB2-A-2]TFC16443.1 TetR family transcriptional regulator [Cryobacterium sp. MDB2-10]TFC22847.1 TetR family transcriptional regulator [Cryobacterium sp. MDB1-18-2]